MLSLIDVIHCGYCGRKLTNGTKYNYWTIKETGEKRASKTPVYRCQSAQSGIPHNKSSQFRADTIEKIVFECLSEYIGKLQENEDIMAEIEVNQNQAKKRIEAELKKLKKELDKITQGIEIMESHIPDAMLGDYALTVEELANAIRKQKEKAQAQKELISEKEEVLKQSTVSTGEWEELKKQIPSWQQVFENADKQTQRVLVNKLIERIDVTDEQIVVRFKISLEDFLPRISGDSPTGRDTLR